MDDVEAFKAAWNRFAATCASSVAPEATYQAWFAHYLMEHFGVLRVVREVDFGSKYLDEAARATFSGSNLMLDVMVLREPIVDLPRRTHLDPLTNDDDRHLRSGLARLDQFLVISEMKVGSTQGKGLSYSAVLRDVHKLDAILNAAKRLYPSIPLPSAFVCVLDNNEQRPLDQGHLQRRLEREATGSRVSVLVHSIAR